MSKLKARLMELTVAAKERFASELQQEQQRKDDLKRSSDMERAERLISVLPDKMCKIAEKEAVNTFVAIDDVRKWHPDAVKKVTEYFESEDLNVTQKMDNSDNGPPDGELRLVVTWG